jgi:hypothetical protein
MLSANWPMNRRPSPAIARVFTLTAAAGLLLSYGCQSSAQHLVGPSGKKCEISVPGSLPPVGPEGGSGSLTIAAARECVWTAASGAAWITISGDRTGQGPGVVNYTASGNPAPQPRRGTLSVDDHQVELVQDAAPCQFTLTPSGLTVGHDGGESVVTVSAIAGCVWTAVSETNWISLVGPAEGSGPGELRVRTQPSSGVRRTGRLQIAGQPYTVTQESPTPSGCTPDVAPLDHPVPAEGATVSVGVSAPGGCAWSAVSHAPWIAVVPGASGTGNDTVGLKVEANTGTQRVGVAAIAGQTVTVTQSGAATPSCSFGLGSTEHSIPASGGTVAIAVTASTGCAWTATTQVPWVTIIQGAVGSGDGAVTLTTAANTGPQRVGSVSIAGQTLTVTQAAGNSTVPCSYALGSTGQSVPAGGGPLTVDVITSSGCLWMATTQVAWITVTDSAQRSGNGAVALTVAPNIAAERSGIVSIAGQPFTVTQAAGASTPPPCSYQLTSAEQSVGNSGGPITIGVSAPTGCAWTATTTADWITITNGTQGSGAGTVTLSVAANTGPDRSGTVTVAAQIFTVKQASGTSTPPPCAYDLTAAGQSVATSGGEFTVGVTTTNGCAWTAISQADWITVTSGASGSGSGTVGLSAAANPGPLRVGTVVIAGRTFTVTQAGACSYSVNPTEQSVPSLGGNFSVAVSAQAGCDWTATANVSWISITSDGTGVGSGTVTYRVSPGTVIFARQGTITVAGHTVTVSQAGLLGAAESQSAMSVDFSALRMPGTR